MFQGKEFPLIFYRGKTEQEQNGVVVVVVAGGGWDTTWVVIDTALFSSLLWVNWATRGGECPLH